MKGVSTQGCLSFREAATRIVVVEKNVYLKLVPDMKDSEGVLCSYEKMKKMHSLNY